MKAQFAAFIREIKQENNLVLVSAVTYSNKEHKELQTVSFYCPLEEAKEFFVGDKVLITVRLSV